MIRIYIHKIILLCLSSFWICFVKAQNIKPGEIHPEATYLDVEGIWRIP